MRIRKINRIRIKAHKKHNTT